MTSVKPIAIVSPMKKNKKSKKKCNKICPEISKFEVKNLSSNINYDIFNKSSFTSECDSTESSIAEQSVDEALVAGKNSNRLCSMFDNLNLEPETIYDISFHNISPQIPDHDRKILERMASKMKQEISNIKMAHKARALWEEERENREKLQKEHEIEYNKYIQAKRDADREQAEQKIRELKELYDWEKKHLRHKLISKDRLAAKRLEDLERRRNKDIQLKHNLAEEKAKNVLDVIREKKLTEILWRKQLAQSLERRILHADNNRDLLLKYCRQRAIIDSRIHHELHKRNWRDVKDTEMERWTMLKRRVDLKRRKMNRIQQEKDKFLMQSRKLAESTSRMRENLKRSLSPDTFLRAVVQNRHQHYRSTPDMCFTPNNFESHIRLG